MRPGVGLPVFCRLTCEWRRGRSPGEPCRFMCRSAGNRQRRGSRWHCNSRRSDLPAMKGRNLRNYEDYSRFFRHALERRLTSGADSQELYR